MRIGKLVRLMASDNDAEVLAAAHAIERSLLAANLTLHDLAQLIDGKPTVKEYPKQAPHPDGPAPWEDAAPFEFICDQLLDSTVLSPREREFIGSILRQSKRYAGFKLSEKQQRWFNAITERYGYDD